MRSVVPKPRLAPTGTHIPGRADHNLFIMLLLFYARIKINKYKNEKYRTRNRVHDSHLARQFFFFSIHSLLRCAQNTLYMRIIYYLCVWR